MNVRNVFVLTLALLIAIGDGVRGADPFFAPNPAAGALPTGLEKLRQDIDAVLQQHHTPGAGIAIVRRSGPEWVGGVGLADTATRRPATRDTLFRIGSVSKMFVALSLLKLEQEGRLSLQDTLRSRAPGLEFTNRWEATDPVRLVHLVEHTTGWDDMAMSEYTVNRVPEIPLRAGLAYRPVTRTSRWKPGTRYSYSNAGAAAAAAVIEQVTGRRFEDYVAAEWFRPLEMRTAGYFDTPESRRQLTTLYRWDGRATVPYAHILLRPPGAVNASAADMVRLLEFLLGRGTIAGRSLLPAMAIDRMERPATTYAARDGLVAGYGLANYVTTADGWVWHGHNGAILGGVTELAYQPDLGVGYVIMVNSGNGLVLQQICRLVRAHLTAGEARPAALPACPVPSELARTYAGWYELITPRNEIARFAERIASLQRIKFQPTGCRTKPWFRGGSAEYVFTGGRLLRRNSDPQPSLALISERAEGTLIQFGAGPTYRRIPGLLVAAEIAMVAAALLFALSSVAVAVIWGIRRANWAGGFVDWPLVVPPALAAAALATFWQVLLSSLRDPIARLGVVGPWSLALWALSIAYPLLSIASAGAAIRGRRAGHQRLVWWHALAASSVFCVLAAYAAYSGLLGWRPWV